MSRLKFPAAPLVLGFVLGDAMERALRQSLMMSQGDLIDPRVAADIGRDAGFRRGGPFPAAAAALPPPEGSGRLIRIKVTQHEGEMPMNRRRLMAALLATGAALGGPAAALAQWKPSRPIELVVHSGPAAATT